MAKRTIDFGGLATDAPMTARLPSLDATPPRVRRVPVEAVAPNPINPRGALGDLADLESMKDGQLQPCVVVTRAAFVAIHPEHEAALGAAEYVVLAGSRRRAAAEKFGVPTLDVMVRDELAADQGSFSLKAITENVDRLNLNPMEEARAVELLAGLLGTANRAAEALHRSPGWVRQRRILLDLTPDMQAHLLAGDLKIEDAREIGKLPPEEQEPTWKRWLAERAGVYGVNDAEAPGEGAESPADAPEQPAVGERPPARPKALRYPPSGQPADFVTALFDSWPRDFVEAAIAEALARIGDTSHG